MKRCLVPLFVVMVLFAGGPARSDEPIKFGQYFNYGSLRFDLFLIDNVESEKIILDHITTEGAWRGSPKTLIDQFECGRYRVRLLDKASDRLIYSQGFDSMSGEYRSLPKDLKRGPKVFRRSIRTPLPKRPFIMEVGSRDARNVIHTIYELEVDPDDYHIINPISGAGGISLIYDRLDNGEPENKIDIVILAEGYVDKQRDKFLADVDRMTEWLFETEPFKSRKSDFNIIGIFEPSKQRGTDQPRQEDYRITTLGSSFNTFDIDDRLLVEDGHRLREIAGLVPYDAIVVLVNSGRYGGWGIYNDYCIVTADNISSRQVFLREFGRTFAGLADESPVPDAAYRGRYPSDVEPLEPNITAFLDPAHVKWAEMLSPDIDVPTKYPREEFLRLQADKLNLSLKMYTEDCSPDRILDVLKANMGKLDAKVSAFRRRNADIAGKVGLFEGAAHSSTGLYRPMLECLMSEPFCPEFCAVCARAISKRIDFYKGD